MVCSGLQPYGSQRLLRDGGIRCDSMRFVAFARDKSIERLRRRETNASNHHRFENATASALRHPTKHRRIVHPFPLACGKVAGNVGQGDQRVALGYKVDVFTEGNHDNVSIVQSHEAG